MAGLHEVDPDGVEQLGDGELDVWVEVDPRSLLALAQSRVWKLDHISPVKTK